jgi:16S rRNA (guanine527-N7)-methyltransferase
MVLEKVLNVASIPDLLAPFGIEPTDAQSIQIVQYVELLLLWNKSLNLSSIQDPQEILTRHFGESMFLCNLVPVENCRLADVGTGAGFPGLAIKIIRPSVQVTLIESTQRKCAFLSEVVRKIGVSGVEISLGRFEDIQMPQRSRDILTARAIGGWAQLLGWAKSVVTPTGNVALWVGEQDSIKISRTPGWAWDPPVRIPDSQRRFLLVGRRLRKSV